MILKKIILYRVRDAKKSRRNLQKKELAPAHS